MSFTSETKAMLGRVPAERLEPIYLRHEVAPSQGPQALLDEVCLDGANTIASIFRGWDGVEYDEVVRDVADQLNVEASHSEPRELEVEIIAFVVQKYLAGATPEQREQVADVLRSAGADFNRMKADILKGAFAAGTLALLIRQVGQKVVAQVVGKIMLRIAGRQAAKEASKRAAQLAGMAIPLLNVVMIGWTVVDIAGPAFRKTVPTVIEVALLRLEYGEES